MAYVNMRDLAGFAPSMGQESPPVRRIVASPVERPQGALARFLSSGWGQFALGITVIGVGGYAFRQAAKALKLNEGMGLWVKDVETQWTPTPGLFITGTPFEIAKEILDGHDYDLASSMSALMFYINRNRSRLQHDKKHWRILQDAKVLIREYGLTNQQQREGANRRLTLRKAGEVIRFPSRRRVAN